VIPEIPLFCPLCNKEVTMMITDMKQEEHEEGLVQFMKARFSCGHTSETTTRFPTVIEVVAQEKICPYDEKPCQFSHSCEFCHVYHRSVEK